MVVLTGGCGQQVPLAALPPLPDASPWTGQVWGSISAGLGPRLDPTSSNVCTRGALACMDAVVAEMTGRLEPLAASCSHLAPFALMYHAVSDAVRRSVQSRRYRDPAYVAHLDAVFGTLYFHALDAWRAGHLGQVPGAWQLAFRAAQRERTSTLGDMLLGMNAHISRDLPYALAAVGLRYPNGHDATADVRSVNTDIGEAQDPMLRMIARRFDPSLSSLIAASKWIDPRTVAAVIADWRLEALRNAQRLLAARSPSALEHVETDIDNNATLRGLLIWRATEVPQTAQTSRDHYCAGRAAPEAG
jgi:hypothetical protein